MPADRSHRTTQGTQNAAARALWRAMGTAEQDLNRPIIAIANSFNQFVPGHVHLKDLGHISPEAAKGGLIALVQNGTKRRSISPTARSPARFALLPLWFAALSLAPYGIPAW